MPSNVSSIKQNPELRHFLRHVLYAIEELCLGNKKAAQYEIESIKSMVSWNEDNQKFRRFCKHKWKGGEKIEKERRKEKRREKL